MRNVVLYYGLRISRILAPERGESKNFELVQVWTLTLIQGPFEELCSRRMADREITSLCWDTLNEDDPLRLAIGTRLGVQVWTMSLKGQLSLVFAADFEGTPSALKFVDNPTRDVQVFSAWDGTL